MIMSTTTPREFFLSKIKNNIQNSGYHLYSIIGGQCPRYSYTIGLSESPMNSELVFAGGYCFDTEEVAEIIKFSVDFLRDKNITNSTIMNYKGLVEFRFQKIDPTWIKILLLGCMDYYATENISGYQIIPDKKFMTKEIPDMNCPYNPKTEPVWRWLTEIWSYGVPKNSTAATNLSSLKGDTIIEASRWEDDYWELFSYPGDLVSKDDHVVVPLGILLAMDATLEIVTKLNVNQGLWRDDVNSRWNNW
jgi:hypothetical protein